MIAGPTQAPNLDGASPAWPGVRRNPLANHPAPGHNQPAKLVCVLYMEEVGMKRVLTMVLGVLLLAAPGFAQATKGKPRRPPSQPRPKR